MEVSAERLAEVDQQLEELGRSDEQITAVLARYEDREAPSLEEIDAELAALEADLQGMDDILARVRESVGSALAEESAEPAEAPSEAEADARAEAAEPEGFDEDLPTTESEPPPAVSDAGSTETADGEPAAGEPSSLSAAELFAEAQSQPPPSHDEVEAEAEADFAALFGDEERVDAADEGAIDLADSLEGDVVASQPEASAHPEYEEEPEDSTSVFTSEDIQAIRADASQPPPARRSSAPPPPRDPEIDALLGDDEAVFRPSSPPPAETEAQPVPEDAASGEFELLVDEDVMLIEDDEDVDFPDEAPTRAAASAFDPDQEEPTNVEAASEGEPNAEGEDEGEGGEKKGFFKKLFGND